MSKKQQKKNQPKSSILSSPSSQQSQPINDQEAGKFICQCGKNYQSYAAVYAHIKSKHPQADKKEMKLNTLVKNDPKKKYKELKGAIPIKDLYANIRLSEFTSTAATALQNIAEYIRNYDHRKNTTTKFDNYQDDLVEQDLEENDEDFQQVQQDKKENQINRKVLDLKHKYHFNEIQNIEGAEQLKSIQISNTKICMIKELTKYFNLQFASKIHLSLQLIISQKLGISFNERRRYEIAIKQLWGELYRINQILKNYASEWRESMDKPQQ